MHISLLLSLGMVTLQALALPFKASKLHYCKAKALSAKAKAKA